MTATRDDEKLWRIKIIDQSFAEGEMTEDEVVEALLDVLGFNSAPSSGTQLEKRLRDFQTHHNKVRSPLIAALLSGEALFENFLLWKDGDEFAHEPEGIESLTGVEPTEGNILTDSYDNEGNMLPPWYVFPDTPMTSMQWRLGMGAAYLTVFGAWFQGLERPIQQGYIEKYPVPESFQELYLFKDLL